MKVQLTDKAWKLMRGYVDLCKYEISGLGKVERDENDNFIVTDIEIFTQKVSGAHSNIEASDLAKFNVELIRKGENPKNWYLWWHSHATMDVFFSGTDTGTIDSSVDFGVLLSLVTNHKHEFKARVDVYEPVRLYTTLDVEILEDEDDEVLKHCQAEIDAKVSAPSTYTPSGKYHHTIGGERTSHYYGRDDEDDDDNFIPPYQRSMGFKGTGDFLPTAVELDADAMSLETDKIMEQYDEYMETKADLKIELKEAKTSGNKADEQVAKQMLREHITKGRQLGFEN